MNIYVCVCVCAHVLKYLCIQNQIMYKSALTTVTHTGHPATHCNTADTLQHWAAHCNTLQHTAIQLTRTARHCNTLQHAATHCSTPQHPATPCNTLQHPATPCSTLQHPNTDNTTHDSNSATTSHSRKGRRRQAGNSCMAMSSAPRLWPDGYQSWCNFFLFWENWCFTFICAVVRLPPVPDDIYIYICTFVLSKIRPLPNWLIAKKYDFCIFF